MLMIFTPTWIDPATGQDALRREVRAAIELQVIDRPWVWVIGRENPYPIGDHRNVLRQYQRAREMFLTGARPSTAAAASAASAQDAYTSLLTIEHDNLLPDTDAVQRLLDTPGDVIYAPYLLRHGARTLNTWQYINDLNLGMSLSHYQPELQRARETIVHRVSGAGFGCTLIRRRVLAAIEFTGATERDQNQCPDLRFAEACLRKYYVSNGRFDVPVMHWDKDSGDWLHPFQNRRNKMGKYLARTTANALAAGRRVRLTAGEVVDLSEEEARELNSLGLIGGADQAPAPDKSETTDGTDKNAIDGSEINAPVIVDEINQVAKSSPPPSRRNREKSVKGQ